jgi:NCS1 family nucleobase:cation symporter-1
MNRINRVEERNKVQVLKPSKLVNKDLIPTKINDRVVGWKDLTWLWLGMAAQMGVFLLGASFVGGLTFFEAVIAILIGSLGSLVVLVLIGDIGIEHGVNFSTFIRAPFGYIGSYIPMLFRAIAAICWFGIQTYFGSTAIDFIIVHFFGYSNVPLWFFIFGIIQILITAKGIKGIKWVENIAAPALLILCIWVMYIFISKKSVNAILFFPITKKMSFWAAVTASLSYWSTVSINIPDFTRFVKVGYGSKGFVSRNWHTIIGQSIGIPAGMVIFSSVGIIGAMTTGFGNPVQSIYVTLPSSFFIVVGLVIVILAQLSTNIAANLFAPGYILNSIGSPKISFSTGVMIAGMLGMLTFPWLLIEFFLTYLPILGAFLAPVSGIMISDYYFIRKRRLSILDLYIQGEFHYFKGFNPAAYITYIVSSVIGLLFLKYSWLLSLPISMILYYLLMKYWILNKYPQKEAEEMSDDTYLASSADRVWSVEIEEFQKASTITKE